MQISTSEFLLGSLPNLLAQQSNINQLNQEIASGQTMPDAASDPAGAAAALQTAGQIQQLTYDASNAQAGTQSIETALGVLQQVNTAIDQLNQIALSGASASTSANTRSALVVEAQNALQQLIQLGNTQDASGNYIFAGSKTNSAPFVVAADGQVSFVGDAATNAIEIAPGLAVPVTASAQGIFTDLPIGNNGVAVTADADNSGGATVQVQAVTSLTQAAAAAGTQYSIAFTQAAAGGLEYTVASGAGPPGSVGFAASSGVVASGSFAAGTDLQFAGLDVAISGTPAAGDSFTLQPGATQSLFQTVQQLIAGLQSPAQAQSGGDAGQQQIQSVIGNLAAGQSAVLTAEAALGAGQSQIQTVQNQDQSDATQATTQLSNLQSANLPQVMASYSACVTALQAAEEAFARIQNLTLFSVIGP
ncbi:MAG TPA: flagellar hook-associated protein FlgL [Stellaceae bacterium]|nr:flagellar hook-associated protein FlgL [Stellaceae bacterium]